MASLRPAVSSPRSSRMTCWTFETNASPATDSSSMNPISSPPSGTVRTDNAVQTPWIAERDSGRTSGVSASRVFSWSIRQVSALSAGDFGGQDFVPLGHRLVAQIVENGLLRIWNQRFPRGKFLGRQFDHVSPF